MSEYSALDYVPIAIMFLVAAGLLEDPRAMLGRLNSLLEKLLNK